MSTEVELNDNELEMVCGGISITGEEEKQALSEKLKNIQGIKKLIEGDVSSYVNTAAGNSLPQFDANDVFEYSVEYSGPEIVRKNITSASRIGNVPVPVKKQMENNKKLTDKKI